MLGMPGGALAGETRLWGTERPKRAQLTAPAPAMTPLRCLPSPATPLIETLKLELDASKSDLEALNEVGRGDWVDSRLMGEPCCEPHLLDVSVDESCRPPPARPFCW